MRKLQYQWYVLTSDQSNRFHVIIIVTSDTSASLLHLLSSVHVTLRVKTEGGGGGGGEGLGNS